MDIPTKWEFVAAFFYILGIASKYIAGSVLFIWTINTLFSSGIPFTLKTCFAGALLIWLARLFLRGLDSFPSYDDTIDESDLSDIFDKNISKVFRSHGRITKK
jgi:hypothetical protein